MGKTKVTPSSCPWTRSGQPQRSGRVYVEEDKTWNEKRKTWRRIRRSYGKIRRVRGVPGGKQIQDRGRGVPSVLLYSHTVTSDVSWGGGVSNVFTMGRRWRGWCRERGSRVRKFRKNKRESFCL